ncbi:hypothetical protein [Clostridium beijerinckii]|uniref:Uncharacterized protein n=1 Tax=Clostridium beijerinckii TaxID=1520 RepID=A0AAX0B439_CLOBE|nr:hypothetical protein [Clostridium beijerinckii]NRT90070.1 hypothetical protein [Clostridium beijerinckii]NYC69600.1 hypothetical protein [Clostridium beijerinckii]
MKKYLSYEDQFKDILNQEEISRIENNEVREIRWKYWNLAHKAFIDERNILDAELGKVLDELRLEEQKELAPYRKMKI